MKRYAFNWSRGLEWTLKLSLLVVSNSFIERYMLLALRRESHRWLGHHRNGLWLPALYCVCFQLLRTIEAFRASITLVRSTYKVRFWSENCFRWGKRRLCRIESGRVVGRNRERESSLTFSWHVVSHGQSCFPWWRNSTRSICRRKAFLLCEFGGGASSLFSRWTSCRSLRPYTCTRPCAFSLDFLLGRLIASSYSECSNVGDHLQIWEYRQLLAFLGDLLCMVVGSCDLARHFVIRWLRLMYLINALLFIAISRRFWFRLLSVKFLLYLIVSGREFMILGGCTVSHPIHPSHVSAIDAFDASCGSTPWRD